MYKTGRNALRCVALRGVAWRCVALRGVAWRCVALRGVAWRCSTELNYFARMSAARSSRRKKLLAGAQTEDTERVRPALESRGAAESSMDGSAPRT